MINRNFIEIFIGISSQIASRISFIILNLIIVNNLGLEKLGLYSLFINNAQWVLVLLFFSSDFIINRIFPEIINNTLKKSFILFNIIIVAILSIFLIIFISLSNFKILDNEINNFFLFIIFFYLFSLKGSSLLQDYYRSQKKFLFFNLIIIFQASLIVILAYIYLKFFDIKIINFINILSTTYFLIFIFSLIYFDLNIRKYLKFRNLIFFYKIIKKNFYLALSWAAIPLIDLTLLLLLRYYFTYFGMLEDVGLFFIAISIVMILLMPIRILFSQVTPHLYSMTYVKYDLLLKKIIEVSVYLLICLSIFIFLLGPFILQMVLENEVYYKVEAQLDAIILMALFLYIILILQHLIILKKNFYSFILFPLPFLISLSLVLMFNYINFISLNILYTYLLTIIFTIFFSLFIKTLKLEIIFMGIIFSNLSKVFYSLLIILLAFYFLNKAFLWPLLIIMIAFTLHKLHKYSKLMNKLKVTVL